MIKNFLLKKDSRDLRFSGDTVIPPTFSLPEPDTSIEPTGATDCTCMSICKVCTSQTGVLYDPLDLWERVPNRTPNGCEPRDALTALLAHGLQPMDKTLPRDTRWKAYFRVDLTSPDAFQSIQMAMIDLKSCAMINTEFYQDWEGQTTLPIGDTPVSGHSYVMEGWNESVAVLDMHEGYKVNASQTVIDSALKVTGCSAFIPTTQAVGEIRDKTIMEKILDYLTNLLLLLKQQTMTTTLNPLPAPDTSTANPISPVMQQTMIQKWATAIAHWEGAVPSSNNPGNMKLTTLTKSWGATQGKLASDGGYLCQFPTQAQGFTALCNFLTLGCEDELKAFHQARTLQTFTEVYAGNPPQSYIQGIADLLGVSLDIQISTFL